MNPDLRERLAAAARAAGEDLIRDHDDPGTEILIDVDRLLDAIEPVVDGHAADANERAHQAEMTLAHSDLIHSGIRSRAEATATFQAEQAEAAKQAAYADRAKAIERADKAEAERDAVYRERAHLVALLTAHYPAELHENDDTDYPDWPLVFVQLPTGQASWHLSPPDTDLFGHVKFDTSIEWDDHTTEQKYERIRQHTAALAAEPAAPIRDAGSYRIVSDNDVDCQWVRVNHKPCGVDIFGDYDGTDPTDLDAAQLLSLITAHHCPPKTEATDA